MSGRSRARSVAPLADNTGPELQSAGSGGPVSTGEEQAVERVRPPHFKGEVTDGVLGVKAQCVDIDAPSLGLGDVSYVFANYVAGQLLNLTVSGKLQEGPIDLSDLNALMHLAAAVEPADELEAALAAQMAMLHHLSMDCGRRAMATGATVEGRALNVSQAGKLSRSYAMLMDTLARHRGRVTTQRFVVENVTVQAGGQAVVGPVTGGAPQKKPKEQSDGQADRGHAVGAERAALPGSQSRGQSMPTAREQRQEAMPHARRRGGDRGAARQ